jgi:hypothetical protein
MVYSSVLNFMKRINALIDLEIFYSYLLNRYIFLSEFLRKIRKTRKLFFRKCYFSDLIYLSQGKDRLILIKFKGTGIDVLIRLLCNCILDSSNTTTLELQSKCQYRYNHLQNTYSNNLNSSIQISIFDNN